MLKIAINGHGGSGKTSLADALGAQLEGCLVKHTDDYFSYNTMRFEEKECLDDFIVPLSRGIVPLVHHKYEHDNKSYQQIESAGFTKVIFEGVGAWREAFATDWNLKIWVDEDQATCFERMSKRDGYDTWPTGTHERWWQEETELFRTEQHKQQADLVLGAGSTQQERLAVCIRLIDSKQA